MPKYLARELASCTNRKKIIKWQVYIYILRELIENYLKIYF